MLSVELGLLSLGFTSQIRWRDSPVFADLQEGKPSAHPKEGAAAWAEPSRSACCCPRVRVRVSKGQQCLVLHRTTGHIPSFLQGWDF